MTIDELNVQLSADIGGPSIGAWPTTYGEKMPRHEYVVKQVYESLFNHQVKRDIDVLVKQAKDGAHLSIAAQVLETVKKEFSK
jgi:hypothetical protein